MDWKAMGCVPEEKEGAAGEKGEEGYLLRKNEPAYLPGEAML